MIGFMSNIFFNETHNNGMESIEEIFLGPGNVSNSQSLAVEFSISLSSVSPHSYIDPLIVINDHLSPIVFDFSKPRRPEIIMRVPSIYIYRSNSVSIAATPKRLFKTINPNIALQI